MERHIVKAFAERFDGPQVAGVTLDEQLVERLFRGRSELERVVFDRLDAGGRQAEAVFDLGTGLQDVHQTLRREPHDGIELLLGGGRDGFNFPTQCRQRIDGGERAGDELHADLVVTDVEAVAILERLRLGTRRGAVGSVDERAVRALVFEIEHARRWH